MGSPDNVVPHHPAWHEDFLKISGHLQPFLAGIPHRIEHVGSTSVPGLAAKPIIDLDVVVPAAGHVAPAIAALAHAGWVHEGNLGIEGREAFEVLPGLPRHHLYLVVEGSEPYRNHADLRDFLRSHPAEAQRYAAAKRELSPLLATDRRLYTEGKNSIVEELLALARRASGRGLPLPGRGAFANPEPFSVSDGTVVLRPLTMDDAAAHLAGEDSEFSTWLSGGVSTGETVRRHIERSQALWRDGGPIFAFAICRAGSNDPLGTIDVQLEQPALGSGQANLAYGLYPEGRGHGLATRAVDLAMEFPRRHTDATSAQIRALPGNPRSAAVALRAGFTLVCAAEASTDGHAWFQKQVEREGPARSRRR